MTDVYIVVFTLGGILISLPALLGEWTFEDYRQLTGVQDNWILNPKTHSLEIYNLEEGLYNLFNEYNADEPIQSPLFGDLAFTVGSLFE
jgi:Uma2 family endonuclease